MKEQKSRKEWIKTVAIVFLSIMLVLTFFSNTIMNYSLAEVAVQYVQSGSITAKVRGTGNVVSNDPYEVVIKETRDVESIPVRKGDEVSKGDILLNLKEQESGELKEARKELEAAQSTYQNALLADYSNSVIKDANKGVTAEEMRKRINSAQSNIDNAQAEVDRLQEIVNSYDAAKTQEEFNLSNSNEYKNWQKAKIELIAVEDAKKKANVNTQTLKEKLAYYRPFYLAAWKADSDGKPTISDLQYADTDYYDATKNCYGYKNADKVFVSVCSVTEYDKLEKTDIPAAEKTELDATLKYNNAQSDCNQLEAYYNKLKDNSEYIKNKYDNDQAQSKKELEVAQKTLTEAQEKLSEILGDSSKTLELQGYLAAIDEAQAKVDKLAGEVSSTTLVAPISGTIMSINATSGKQVDNGSTVMTIQPKGEAFTMDVTCTVDQAKKLSVGDYAEVVNSWRYGNIDVVLEKIVADKSNPAQNKILKFSVTGDVTDGQSLSISIGSRSQNYDLIVPSSAVREDNNGKFILVVEAKSSPLGNRYIATRYDVEVLASDDKQTAISAALYGGEYVITTATKPINPGDQVRLANE